MTTISGAGEESAITAWGKTMLAQSQKANAERDAAEAAEIANPGSTTVTLSDEVKAIRSAMEWRERSIQAIQEKASIQLAQWDHAVRTAGTDEESSLYAKFANAGEAEKEAYVQRKLIDFDTRRAFYDLSQQFSKLVNIPVSGGTSDAEYARMRERTEEYARYDVLLYSNDPYIHTRSAPDDMVTPSNAQQNIKDVAPAAQVKNTEQSIAAAQHARLDQMRQAMGAGSGAATDPAVQKYALPSAPGQASTAEQLAVAQLRIDKVQSEFGALAEIWQKAAERGEKWALPDVPNPSADNTGVNTFRYEENNHRYLPDIADLSLEVAKWSLAIVESDIRNSRYPDIQFHSHYGDQEITDMGSYVAAAKDHISKLESAAAPSVVGAANGD